ncbi:hypothetical protein NP493_750g00012 [Ridgeia piscesae]|uniref:Uncharacterized protein n=1 Tax=Ridgeia piscesae TaxID=27915 RepID=A0AAD9KP47_RIDPI|nr:hypothetical protein NP493_750g00012 [Ridgeia piscesae]
MTSVTRLNPPQTAIASRSGLEDSPVYLGQEWSREQVILGRLRLSYASNSSNPNTNRTPKITCSASRTLRALMNPCTRCTLVEWGDGEYAQSLFWQRLHDTLLPTSDSDMLL